MLVVHMEWMANLHPTLSSIRSAGNLLPSLPPFVYFEHLLVFVSGSKVTIDTTRTRKGEQH